MEKLSRCLVPGTTTGADARNTLRPPATPSPAKEEKRTRAANKTIADTLKEVEPLLHSEAQLSTVITAYDALEIPLDTKVPISSAAAQAIRKRKPLVLRPGCDQLDADMHLDLQAAIDTAQDAALVVESVRSPTSSSVPVNFIAPA